MIFPQEKTHHCCRASHTPSEKGKNTKNVVNPDFGSQICHHNFRSVKETQNLSIVLHSYQSLYLKGEFVIAN